ncbi:Eco57I restriction-modification methylase domain-containing protein [Bdellovibrio sp. HCB117]|uniref:Eco57I restriction-modification methylase domain-containing protein n=1 Tax=Bdellovibrio sp. HCB117 TaxID=3394359 RepID=UPI0039B4AF1A
MHALAIKPTAHIVDVLGNVIGRDQPILRMEKALEMVALLGEEIFANENVVFFDPFCKAGELLLACAFHSCLAKSKGQTKLLDIDMVMKEIFQSNRYFGLAPDERHHRLSIRTFLGNEHSHNEKFNHIIRDGHYLSEEDGTLDKEKFEREFKSMIEYISSKAKNKKVIAVGNPPYSENDNGGNGSGARAIYPYFVESLINADIIEKSILVIPSKWFSSGRDLEKFKNKIINSNHVKSITYFENSKNVFPTVNIDGGVCYLNLDKFHNDIPLFFDGLSPDVGSKLDLTGLDIIPDDPKAIPILKKVRSKWTGKFISDKSIKGRAFGPRTFYFKRNRAENKPFAGSIGCIGTGKVKKYIDRSAVTSNQDKIDHYKICVPVVYGGRVGDQKTTLPPHAIWIAEAGTVVTETYMVVYSSKNKKEVERVATYLRSDFSRYLFGLRKLTASISWEKWLWVPLLEMNRDWSDEDLFDFFNFTKEERSHIKRKVKEWS